MRAVLPDETGQRSFRRRSPIVTKALMWTGRVDRGRGSASYYGAMRGESAAHSRDSLRIRREAVPAAPVHRVPKNVGK